MTVISITGEDAYEQGVFEGIPVIESRYRLKGVKPLPHDAPLELFQHVSFTGEGRVRAVHFEEVGEVQVKRVYDIEVLEARLDG